MKRIKHFLICLFVLLLTSNTTFANTSIYDQLCKLNKEWLKVTPNESLKQSKYFESEQAIITYHLQQVELALRNKDVNHLSKSAIEKRNEGLAVLQAYWKQATYPKNFDYDFSVPFFIDDYNTACAVGYIMQGTGNELLAQEISESQNNAYVRDIKHKDLADWAKEYGFTADELAWIQPSYSPCWNGGPYFQENRTLPSCGSADGAITLTDYSNSDYTFEWNVGGSSLVLTNLSAGVYVASGTYFDSWYDVECPFEYIYILDNEQGPELAMNATVETCSGMNDGTATVNVINGAGTYSYEWTNGSNSNSINNLTAGRHYAYVTDQEDCTSIEQAWISTANAMYHYETGQGSECNNNTGAIDLNISGGAGSGNYTYQWNDGNTNEDRTSLASGEYSVVVTDDVGCNIEIEKTIYDDCLGRIVCEDDFVDVNNESGTYINQFANDTDTSPAEITTVFIIQQPLHGSAFFGYQYGVFPDASTNFIYNANDETYTGPDSFVYEVCTTYGFCDQATVYLNVVSSPTPTINAAQVDEDFTICEGETIALVASGGQNYAWSPSIGLNQTTGNTVYANPTSTTTYTLITDNTAGEIAYTSITIEVVPEINASFTMPTTIGTNGAAVNLLANTSGGNFSGNGVFFNAFNPAVAGPGLHEITYDITDENGCSSTTVESILVFSATYNFINYNLGTISPRFGELVFETQTKVFGNYTVQLFDLIGKPIILEEIEINNEEEQHSISTSALPTGVYVLSLSNEQSVFSKQIIISN